MELGPIRGEVNILQPAEDFLQVPEFFIKGTRIYN
jgi:hypothetical protein